MKSASRICPHCADCGGLAVGEGAGDGVGAATDAVLLAAGEGPVAPGESPADPGATGREHAAAKTIVTAIAANRRVITRSLYKAPSATVLGVPLRSVSLAQQALPPVPDGAFIVQGEHDQFGSAAELRAALPHARVVEIPGVDHLFIGKFREVAATVADQLLRDTRLAG